jgi:hypothetical protein
MGMDFPMLSFVRRRFKKLTVLGMDFPKLNFVETDDVQS